MAVLLGPRPFKTDGLKMTAKDALESGRQRVLLERAEQVKVTLQGVPKSDILRSINLLLDLAGVLVQLERGTERLADASAKEMWQERVAWMRSELVALLAERLQSPDAALFWENIALTLHISASVRLDLVQEKDALQNHIAAQAGQEKMGMQQKQQPHLSASSSTASAPAHMKPGHVQQVTANGRGYSKEVMALQTKLVMAQQDLQRRTAEARDMTQRMQASAAERDKMQAMYDELLSKINPVAIEKQASAVQECEALREHARMLSANLESHARVVESLIGLNTELMEAANARAFGNEKVAHADSANENANTALNVRNGLGEWQSRHPEEPPWRLPLSTVATHPSSASYSREATPLGPFESSRPEHSSLASAFAQILQESAATPHDHRGKRATVESLALPAQPVHGESHMQHQERGLHAGDRLSPDEPARSGVLASLSKAADLVLYVAGSPAAMERRARRIGHRTAAL
ncbi:g1524 [Coccomyxa elongata]